MPFFGGGDYRIVGTNIDGGNDVLGSVTGDYNIGIGPEALRNVSTGSDNIGIGYQAGNLLTSGFTNICIGSYAGLALTTGQDNTVVGGGAGGNYSYNTLIGSLYGYLLGENVLDSNNVVVGYSALNPTKGGASPLTENVVIGNNAFSGALTASWSRSVIAGHSAMRGISAVGNSGIDLTALGAYSGGNRSAESLSTREVGTSVFVGANTLCKLSGSTGAGSIGTLNSAVVGTNSGSYTSNAATVFSYADIVALGNNITFGYNNATNRIVIGNDIASATDNQITVGDVSHTSIFIAGKDVTNVLTPTPTFTAVTLTGGTVAVSTPVLSATQTWNAGAVAFDLWTADVTNTASSADSTMLNLKLGGTSLLQFKPAGGGLLAGAPSLQVGTGATTQRGWIFGTISSSLSGMWITGVTISNSNYVLANNNATTFLQAPTAIQFNINGIDKCYLNSNNFRLDAAHVSGWSGTTASTALDTAFSRESAGLVQVNNGTANAYRDLKVRQHYVDQTITAAGTTGAQTINKAAGTVNFAAAATSLVVTNSLVTANSTIYCSLRTNDATARIANVVPAAGSFTINLTNAATAETSCGFLVIN